MRVNLSKSVAMVAAAVGTSAVLLAGCGSTSTSSGSSTGNLALQVDTVTNQGCVQTNIFRRGEDILVWRVNVFKNGVQDKKATVAVHVKGGQTYKAPWNTKDHFYTAAWSVPFSQPTGTVQYTVTVKDGSLSASYAPKFMVAPAELQIVPANYGVAVTIGSGTKSVTSVAAGSAIPVKANVTYLTDSGTSPLTSGTVTAQVGLEGNVDSKGNLVPAATGTLTYSAGSKAWTGNIPTSGLASGLYVVQVNAQDSVTPPNTGTGTSAAFLVH